MMGFLVQRHTVMFLWCVLTASMAGCASSQPATFYVLSGLDNQEVRAEDQAVLDPWPVIGVGPIKLAGYLDRPQIVTRPSENTLALAEFDKWAEPLSDNIGRVIAQNLSVLLHGDRFLVRPWDAVPLTYQVVVEVARFDGSLGDEVTLVARWSVSHERRSNVVIARTSRVGVSVDGQDYEALVAAMNRSLVEFSKEIAAAIRGIPSHGREGM